MIKRLLTFLILFAAITFAVREDIEVKELEIDKTKDKIEQISEHEKTGEIRLERIRRSLNQVKEDIKNIQKRLQEIRETLQRLTNLKVEKEKRLDEILEKKEEAVKNIYMTSGLPDNLAAISDMEIQNRKHVYLQSIASYRDSIFKVERALKDSIAQLIEETAKREDEEKENIKRNLILTDSLRTLERENIKEIERLRGEKQEYIVALKMLEKQLEELRKLGLTEQTIAGKFPAKLPWPTESREILHGFGMTQDARYNTEFYNPGIDIKAEPNEIVRVVHSGTVTHLGWVRGFGNIVVVKHPEDYYTLYGNLDNLYVTKGMELKMGDMIGQVSPTGWLEGSKLHFEIRKGRDEINPLYRLQ